MNSIFASITNSPSTIQLFHPTKSIVIDCGQPQVNTGSRIMGDSYSVHSTIDYRCDPGFKEVSGSTQRICGLDGQWTGQPLTCKCKFCHKSTVLLCIDIERLVLLSSMFC